MRFRPPAAATAGALPRVEERAARVAALRAELHLAKVGRDQHRPKHKAPERVAHALAIAEGEGTLKYTRALAFGDRAYGAQGLARAPSGRARSEAGSPSAMGKRDEALRFFFGASGRAVGAPHSF